MGIEVLREPALNQAQKKGTLVLVHGACFSAWVWKNNFMPFFSEKGFEVWAISLRGHGGSSLGQSLRWTSIKDYQADLLQVLSTIDGPIYLLGHSMGGFTIEHTMPELPPNVKSVVLLCAAPPQGLWRLIGRLIRHYPWALIVSLLRMSWLPMVKDPRKLRGIMLRADFPNEALDLLIPQMQEESFLAFLEMVALRLPAIPQQFPPMMVVGAEYDYLVPVAAVRRTASVYGVDPYLIPQSSHCFMLESGWEEAAEKISQFLMVH